MGLLAIQQGSALAPHLFPKHSFYPTAFNFFKAASNFLLPCYFRIRVNGRVEAIDKAGG